MPAKNHYPPPGRVNQIFERMIFRCPHHRRRCLHCNDWWDWHIVILTVITTKVESEGHVGICLAGYASTPPHPRNRGLIQIVPAKPYVCRVTALAITTRPTNEPPPRIQQPACHYREAPNLTADDKPCLGTSVGEFPLLFVFALCFLALFEVA